MATCLLELCHIGARALQAGNGADVGKCSAKQRLRMVRLAAAGYHCSLTTWHADAPTMRHNVRHQRDLFRVALN
jgi:hypothetical protein